MRQAVALVAGFLVVTGVYSVWLSLQVREWVYIENHGGISICQFGGSRPSGVPSHASDVPFVAGVVLAPLGAVLAWRRREAALLAFWVVLVVLLTSLSGAGGRPVRVGLDLAPTIVVPAGS